MSVKQTRLIFNCTPAQLETALVTTLPAAGLVVTRAPIKFTGWVVGTSGGGAGMGQLDFSYDGQYFLTFFGANPAPVSQQAQAGIPETQMGTALQAYLASTLLATLGAPVPPNQAVPPNPAPPNFVP